MRARKESSGGVTTSKYVVTVTILNKNYLSLFRDI